MAIKSRKAILKKIYTILYEIWACSYDWIYYWIYFDIKDNAQENRCSTMAYFQLLNDAIFVIYFKKMFLVVIKIHQSREANKEGHSIKFMVPQLLIN